MLLIQDEDVTIRSSKIRFNTFFLNEFLQIPLSLAPSSHVQVNLMQQHHDIRSAVNAPLPPLPRTDSKLLTFPLVMAPAPPFLQQSRIQLNSTQILLIHSLFILQQNGFQGIIHIWFFFSFIFIFSESDMYCGFIQKWGTDESGGGRGEYKQNARKWKRHLNSDLRPSVFPTQHFQVVSWVTLSPCRHRIINLLTTE